MNAETCRQGESSAMVSSAYSSEHIMKLQVVQGSKDETWRSLHAGLGSLDRSLFHLAGSDDPFIPPMQMVDHLVHESWLCPALFLDWQCLVRSQPLSVRQALLPQTHALCLVLMPRFRCSPYAQPCLCFNTHTHTDTHVYKGTHTGMSDTSWPLAVSHWISRREATCRVRGDFGVKELGLESSHITRPAGPRHVKQEVYKP